MTFQSTHPREGVRHDIGGIDDGEDNFNPRTPAKECDSNYVRLFDIFSLFQSTHPREGVRRWWHNQTTAINYFNPRTPAKECDTRSSYLTQVSKHFNPRTPAKECDAPRVTNKLMTILFQSTHPREGVRQHEGWTISKVVLISIHAPPRRSAT